MAEDDRVNSLIEDGQKARRGRPPSRAAAEHAERRRRNGVQLDTSALAIPEHIKRDLAEKGLEGRWINDLGNRMYQKTELDDWDRVPEVEPVPVGVDSRTGNPILAHYCAKPAEFLKEDNRARTAKWNAQETAIFAGRDDGELAGDGAYNPRSTQNAIDRRPLS